MNRIIVTARPLMWGLFALGFSCGSCTGTGVTSNNGTSNNGTSNNGGENNGGACLVGTDCPSGICNDGVCAGGTNGTCEDPGPCGNCDPYCRRNGAGSGHDPFTLDNDEDEESQGVVLDEEGAITIDIRKVESHFIWISNTGEGTVSKVDTRTYEEVARYISGPDGQGNDPSRTSVNTFGDVFVGNRSGQSVTKISGRGEDCPDSNGDGVVTTSTGPTNVLPWGQDDCVLWNVRLQNGGIIRAVAAQDGRPNDDTARPAVWIGGWGGVVWKLDAERGDILVETPSPVPNYGFALDGLGNLWISGLSDGGIGRIDTLRCTDSTVCNVAVCDGEDGTDCIKQRIPLNQTTYGITVDFKQRVWVGGEKTTRYDPSQAVGSRIVSNANVPFIHGIAADDKGWIWGAGMASGVIRYDAEDPNNSLAVPGTNTSAKGMAIDLDGKIWAINQLHADATVIVGGPTINDNTVTNNVAPNLVAPYTYSDMTGAQLRFVSDERGYYRRIFEGCPEDGNFLPTVWNQLRWDAETPGNSQITFRVRGADTRADLAAAAWVDVATVPPDTSPKDIGPILEAAGLQGKQFMEVEAQLTAVRDADNNVFAPRLKAMEVTLSCQRRVN